MTVTSPVAVIAAHPDDEVLGCGGTIARFAGEGRSVHVLIMSDGVTARWTNAGEGSQAELAARNMAAEKANEVLGVASVEILGFPDNRMDGIELLDVVKHVEGFIERIQPELVLSHHCGDVNVDHRVVHDAVITACRPLPGACVRELMFFEVPSSTEWRPGSSGSAFWPSVFFDIEHTLERKLDALRAYEEELRDFPHPRSTEAVEALARWRGASAGVPAAEAFLLGRKVA